MCIIETTFDTNDTKILTYYFILFFDVLYVVYNTIARVITEVTIKI